MSTGHQTKCFTAGAFDKIGRSTVSVSGPNTSGTSTSQTQMGSTTKGGRDEQPSDSLAVQMLGALCRGYD